MPAISITIHHLKKRLRQNQALRGVNAFFPSGKIHGIIGPDGAGKTTLLRHVVGLLKADEGSIEFRDAKRLVSFASVRPHMAYMPQQQSLYPDLSIAEHLDFFRDLYQLEEKLYQQRRKELLHVTRLERFTERAAGKLSGGMYKKLGLMCALLQSPQVILLDEPTNGVDPISRREFWEMLYRMLGPDIVILVATAYMDEAERCGQVHLMDEGVCIAEGEPRKVLEAAGEKNFEEIFLKRERLAQAEKKA